MGSLIAALASYLDARANNGQWLLRMEDLDPPREEPGAARRILSSLVDHGLRWDGDVLWQSQRSQAYQQALDKLAGQDRLFRCDCTRSMLGPGGACAGRCLPRQTDITEPCALRVRVPIDCHITFSDGIQGKQSEALGQDFPDFILRRKDGLYAYQLAVVVDDAFQRIDHVLRGSDLLDSTGRQIFLQQLLEIDPPSYSHFPVITNTMGQKYSKQNHSPALLAADAPENLRRALAFLRQRQIPKSLRSCSQILAHAAENWSTDAIPRQMAVVAADP